MKSQSELVQHLKKMGYVKNMWVTMAMKQMDRGRFINSDSEHAYENVEQHFALGINISSPRTHALALESLVENLLNESSHILDLGFGSGYLTACMAAIAGDQGCVIGVDNLPDLLPLARKCIDRCLPQAFDHGQIKLIIGDGLQGCWQYGPYDVIHVGFPLSKIPVTLTNQLKPGGLLFAAVNGRFKSIKKWQNGSLTETDLAECQDIVIQMPPVSNNQAMFASANPSTFKLNPLSRPASLAVASNLEDYIQNENKNSNIVQVNDYEYDTNKKLGEGYFGKVYAGRCLRDKDKEVAIKVLTKIPTIEEWRIMGSVKNNYVLCLIEKICLEPDKFFIITELCQCDLQRFLKEMSGGKMDLNNTRVAVRHMAKGYMALFASDIIHRDIKPENILVQKTEKGARLKLADFGCAKILDKMNKTQTRIGSFGYAAPEVFMNRAYDAKVDIYSLGCVVYKCYSGRRLKLQEDILNLEPNDPQLKDMLYLMTQTKSLKRMSPTQFFDHPFHSSVSNGELINFAPKVPFEDIEV